MSSQCPVCGAVIADPEDCASSKEIIEKKINSVEPNPYEGAYSKYPVIDNAVLALVR